MKVLKIHICLFLILRMKNISHSDFSGMCIFYMFLFYIHFNDVFVSVQILRIGTGNGLKIHIFNAVAYNGYDRYLIFCILPDTFRRVTNVHFPLYWASLFFPLIFHNVFVNN